MHRIRAQAKHSAWYDGPHDENGGFFFGKNPFAKYRGLTHSTTLRSDEESGSLSKPNTSPAHAYTTPHASTSKATGTSVARTTDHDRERFELPAPMGPSPKSSTAEGQAATTSHDAINDDLLIDSTAEIEKPNLEEPVDLEKRRLWSSLGDSKFKQRVAEQLQVTFFNSWLNVTLAFIPAGFIVNYLQLSARTVFAINFLAIIPSTMMISLAVDEIGLRTGDLLGALLNMSFSNATQLISSILLLRSRQITVLKTSLLGSIISNLLLMLGLCMFFGGIDRMEQRYNPWMAETISVMLLLAILSLIMPTASRLMASVSQHDVVVLSRGTSIIIMLSYGLYLIFQLKTHIGMFTEPSAKTPKKNVGHKFKSAVVPNRFRQDRAVSPSPSETKTPPEDELDEPLLNIWVAVSILVLFTVFTGFNAEFATSSIQSMVQQAENLTQTFVGFVILPLLSNDPTSIANAVKDKMDFCIALTLERCMQTALLVVPLVVIVAWGMGVEEMTLEFDGFSVAATFVSIIIVTYVVQDGKSNWLVGALLVKVYVIVALAVYFIRV